MQRLPEPHSLSVQQAVLGMHRFPHFFFPLHFFFLAVAVSPPSARGRLISNPATTRRRGTPEPSTRTIASKRLLSMARILLNGDPGAALRPVVECAE
jgi:hypothetical protein